MNLPIKNEQEDQDIFLALKNSVYPGAKDESIKMVINYCKNAQLDPLQKPVHIVPMFVRYSQNITVWQDVIMPGIGLYRTQASRSGVYAGVSVPQFGEEITEKLAGVEITYPEWCEITVKKLVWGHLVEFVARERWKENYATAKRDSLAPNKMWLKRPYGQLAKCTEAQALRKAFPELTGAQPTYEEMEGKTEFIDVEPEIKPIPIRKNKVLSVEELQQQLDGNELIVLENKVPVMEINQKIKSSKTQDELNELTEEIQNGNYSEADKAEIRKVFKEKKASFLQTESMN